MHRAVPQRQTKVQLHMPPWIFWKVLWKEYFILQAATTPGREAKTFYCIHFVWSFKQVFLPNFLWFHFWKWIRLDSARVLQLSQQQPFQGAAILEGLPSEPEFFQVEQVSPVMVNMNSTLSHSTHLRATFNFKTDGLITTDYWRAKTAYLNILQLNSDPCVKMEYINIRDYDCYDCTALLIQ